MPGHRYALRELIVFCAFVIQSDKSNKKSNTEENVALVGA